MSRQNKVNPGMYTQRGRLTQDDAAREIAKQRSVGSEHTWQPVQRDAKPRLTSASEGAEGTDTGAADDTPDETPRRARKQSARKTPARKKAKTPSRTSARAKKTAAPAVRSKASSARTPKRKAKSAKRRKS